MVSEEFPADFSSRRGNSRLPLPPPGCHRPRLRGHALPRRLFSSFHPSSRREPLGRTTGSNVLPPSSFHCNSTGSPSNCRAIGGHPSGAWLARRVLPIAPGRSREFPVAPGASPAPLRPRRRRPGRAIARSVGELLLEAVSQDRTPSYPDNRRRATGFGRSTAGGISWASARRGR